MAAMKLIAVWVTSACLLAAQDAPRLKNTYHSSGGASAVPRLVSPEVRLDRTIVFRLKAPALLHAGLSRRHGRATYARDLPYRRKTLRPGFLEQGLGSQSGGCGGANLPAGRAAHQQESPPSWSQAGERAGVG